MANASWNLPAPPGFRGLHPELPVTVYYRHLPHWRQDGATYFVTFRLEDSLPQAKRNELKRLKREWLAGRRSALRNGITKVGRNAFRPTFQGLTEEEWEELARTLMEKVERWLDEGMGECWLKRAELRQIVIECLHHLDGDAYELGCHVTMPNHVHAIVRPLRPDECPLEKILQYRKQHSSREINAILGRSGTLWQEESFDRIIRDEEHLWRCIQYIGRNPQNARLPPEQYRLWIRPEWERCGWKFVEA